MLGSLAVDWFIKSPDGREFGPMAESDVRATVAGGRALAVRRASSQVWVPISETPFAPVVAPAVRRVADLTPKEAQSLIANAVASGAIRAGLLLWLLVGLLAALLMLLR